MYAPRQVPEVISWVQVPEVGTVNGWLRSASRKRTSERFICSLFSWRWTWVRRTVSLGDMAGVELEHLPTDRPRRVQQRPVIMPRRLDAYLDHGVDRENLDDVGHHPRLRGPRHWTPRAGFEQQGPSRVGDRERELRLADIDGNHDRR